MKRIISFLLLTQCISLFSQVELVPNPSFEFTTGCPTGGAQWAVCSSWNNVNLNTGAGLWGTPDYMHTCGSGNTAPPATFAGTCSPHTGNAMMAVVLYNAGYANYREYLATQLTCTMQPGTTYTLSFWLSNGTGIKSPWTIQNIGVCFSSGALTQSGWAVISATPQCEITTNVVSTGWTQYTFTINPTASWNYLTIGAFRNDALNNVTLSFTNPGGAPSAYANYFVDDVSVLAPAVVSGYSLSAVVGQPTICGGGATATVSSSNPTVSATYSWLPVNITTTVSSLSNLSPGVYTVIATYPNGCLTSSTAVNFTLNATPSISATLTANSPTSCVSGVVNLFVSSGGGTGTHTYSWTNGPTTFSSAVSQATAGNYVYTVTVRDQINCALINTISVNVLGNPVLVSTNATICPGVGAPLTASGANTYTWNPGATLGNVFTPNPTVVTVYTVTGTAATGCTASSTSTVSIKATPTLSFNTFSITCGSLGSATVYASGGTGPYTYTWIPTYQTNSIATGMYPGTYSVSVLDGGTGCIFTPTTNFAALIPLTGTVIATPSIQCNGINSGTAAITLAGGSGNQNYLWSDALSTQTNSVATNLAAGVDTVFVSDALTFCTVTQTFLITQPPALTLNIIASSPSVCMGGSISLNANTSGGTPVYNYSWTNGPSSNSLMVSEINAGTYVYTISSSDFYNCLTTKTVSALFVNNPTVTVSNTSICPMAIGTLTATGASVYQWSNGFMGNPLLVSPSVTTIYTVTGTALGCTASAVGSVSLKSVPTVSFTSNAPICQGDSLLLSGISTNVTFLWSGPQSFSSTMQDPPTFYNTSPNRSGYYTLKVTAPNTCTAAITRSLTVNPTPPISITGATVCEGSQIQLFSSSLVGANYQWMGPVSFTSTLQNPNIPLSNPLMTGSYSVIVASIPGCTNMAVSQVSVITKPVPVISASNPRCVGGSLSFTASGGTTYFWYGPNGFISNLQYPLISNVSLASGGVYGLYAYNGQCAASTSQSVVIHPLPVPPILSNNPVCEFQNLSLSTTLSAQSYTWIGPGNFTNFNQNTFLNSVGLLSAGMYTLGVTDLNNCIGYSSSNIVVLPAPNLSVSDQTACIGSPVTMSASAGAGYLWAGPSGFSSVSQSFVISSLSSSNTGIYTLTVIGGNSCTAVSTVQLTGFSYPLPDVVISAPSKACVNSAITLRGSGGISYLWNGPNNFVATTQSVSVIVNDSSVAGIYTLTVKTESNCVASNTLHLSVFALPRGVLESTINNQCIPFCSLIKLNKPSGSSEILNIVYSINGSFSKDTSIKYCFASSGRYLVNASFKDTNGCVNTATLVVNANAKPKADFVYSPSDPVAGIDAVKFYNTSGAGEQMQWEWFLDGNDTASVKDKNPQKLFENAGVFPAVLIVRNQFGCSDTVIKPVKIDDEFALYVPNAFTPNGDGLNDVFFAKGKGIEKFSMEIYDRWGEKIFTTDNFNHGWDGTFSGKECKTDSYVWKISVRTSSGVHKTLSGHTTLLRATPKVEE